MLNFKKLSDLPKVDTKRCTKCGEVKLLSEFTKSPIAPDGLQYKCKNCANIYHKVYYEINLEARHAYNSAYNKTRPEAQRASHLKHKYNLTPKDYSKMLNDQNGVCVICHLPSDTPLHVDHDHETGLVRGLLCKDCNLGIGRMKDSVYLLQEAADYLLEASLLVSEAG